MEAKPEEKNRKCELCNFNHSNILDTEDTIFTLCPNHLLAFIMRSLTPKETRKLLQTHGRVAYLDWNFYDDKGHSLQPV